MSVLSGQSPCSERTEELDFAWVGLAREMVEHRRCWWQHLSSQIGRHQDVSGCPPRDVEDKLGSAEPRSLEPRYAHLLFIVVDATKR